MSGAGLSVVFSQEGKEVKRLTAPVSGEDGLADLIDKVKGAQSETNQFLTSLLSEHDIANDNEDSNDDNEDDVSDIESGPDSKVPKIH